MKTKEYHETFMKIALREAQKAYNSGDVPIGAVIVKDDVILSAGYNKTDSEKDPTLHAEMIAIRKAVEILDYPRLEGCSMYVTAEPCTMCAGAIVLARIDKLYIGTDSPKSGACYSLKSLLDDERLNHSVEYETGILKKECETIMKNFFEELRNNKEFKSEDNQ